VFPPAAEVPPVTAFPVAAVVLPPNILLGVFCGGFFPVISPPTVGGFVEAGLFAAKVLVAPPAAFPEKILAFGALVVALLAVMAVGMMGLFVGGLF